MLLQTSKRELHRASAQWLSLLGGAPRPAAAAGTPPARGQQEQQPEQEQEEQQERQQVQRAADSSDDPPPLPDCDSLGPHRREFSKKELALQQQRYRAWQDGAAQGLAMCLVIKGEA